LKTQRIQGLTLALAAAGFATIYDIITRFGSSGITPWQILLTRAAFGLALTAVLARAFHLNPLGRNRPGMLLTGLILVVGVLCFIFALFRLPVFEAVLLLYLYPVFAALFSPFLVDERIGLKLWTLIAIAFCGTAFVLWPQGAVSDVNGGHLLGVASGFCHGLALTLVRRFSRHNGAVTPFFYFCAVGGVVSVVAVGLSPASTPLSLEGWAALGGIAVTAGLAQLCMIKSATCISSAEVGIVGMSEIVFGGLLSYMLFSEAVGARQILGGVLVISSAIVLALDTTRDAAVRREPVLPGEPGRIPSIEAAAHPASLANDRSNNL